jgi:hypothetical protein
VFRKQTFHSILKNALAYYNAGLAVAVNTKVVGLAPGKTFNQVVAFFK